MLLLGPAGHAALAVIEDMFGKPSRMLQRRLITRFSSGSFDAGEGLDVRI